MHENKAVGRLGAMLQEVDRLADDLGVGEQNLILDVVLRLGEVENDAALANLDVGNRVLG